MSITDIPNVLQKKDMIIVDMEKVTKLFQWRDQNRELVHNFHPVLEDVVINVGGLFIHVTPDEDPEFSYLYTVYDKTYKVLGIQWNRYNYNGNIGYNELPDSLKDDEKAMEDYSQSVISIYATLMAYMEHGKEIITKKDVTSKKVKNKKKNKGKGKREKVTYLRRTVYELSGLLKVDPEPEVGGDHKRAYSKPEHAFKVRGHWRHYKNGNTVWVHSYTKNTDEKKNQDPDPKTYKFN